MIVYLITNTFNEFKPKIYVGYTKLSFHARWREHCYDAKYGCLLYFHKAIRKYGKESFSHEILAETNTVEEAKELERLWILSLRAYDPDFGYNGTYGGEGCIPTVESRANQRAALAAIPPEIEARRRANQANKLRGRVAWNKGKSSSNPTLIGKTYEQIYGEEIAKRKRASQSAARRGKPKPKERRTFIFLCYWCFTPFRCSTKLAEQVFCSRKCRSVHETHTRQQQKLDKIYRTSTNQHSDRQFIPERKSNATGNADKI